MKTITLFFLFFILIACQKKYDLKSVLEEFDNPKSDYVFVSTSKTINDEIANYLEMLKSYKKEDTLFSLIDSHVNVLSFWRDTYRDSTACLFAVSKPNPCPCPLIVECLYHSKTFVFWSQKKQQPFKCSVNGKSLNIASDVYMKKYQLRFIELEENLNLKKGDEINIIFPISYYTNGKLAKDSLIITDTY